MLPMVTGVGSWMHHDARPWNVLVAELAAALKQHLRGMTSEAYSEGQGLEIYFTRIASDLPNQITDTDNLRTVGNQRVCDAQRRCLRILQPVQRGAAHITLTQANVRQRASHVSMLLLEGAPLGFPPTQPWV
jgi:hypothetical protein